MIKIALVDDHVILRKSLAVLIEMFPDFQVILQAGNGRDFIDRLKHGEIPDIVLLDVSRCR
jgi:two-component system invasion response regulator UvrY